KIRDIAIKHFIDSLIILRFTKLSFPLLDVGTGPGFPGIPLKIQFPEQRILLAEGVQKRVQFLKKVREELDLKELDILGRYIHKDFSLPVNGVITRAVEDIGLTLGNVWNCLPAGGKVFLMKGPQVDHELKISQKDWAGRYKLVENHSYILPNTPHQRRLIVFEKVNNT
ncbi:MAG: class I SAM-dependent methyltransferase, partial [Bdellovibrionales bacterium]|nr:class I SAM-dependent methyltransferase [Bdellovibrionales bacterium]